jgi:hypothetical protein
MATLMGKVKEKVLFMRFIFLFYCCSPVHTYVHIYEQPHSLIVDETTDARGKPVLACVMVTGDVKILLDVEFPTASLNATTLCQSMASFVHNAQLRPERDLRLLCTDNAAYYLNAVESFVARTQTWLVANALHMCWTSGKDIKACFPLLSRGTMLFKAIFVHEMARRSRFQLALKELPDTMLPKDAPASIRGHHPPFHNEMCCPQGSESSNGSTASAALKPFIALWKPKHTQRRLH